MAEEAIVEAGEEAMGNLEEEEGITSTELPSDFGEDELGAILGPSMIGEGGETKEQRKLGGGDSLIKDQLREGAGAIGGAIGSAVDTVGGAIGSKAAGVAADLQNTSSQIMNVVPTNVSITDVANMAGQVLCFPCDCLYSAVTDTMCCVLLRSALGQGAWL